MIDPFHRWNFLARAKYASRDVIRFVKKHELILEEKSGVLFWPVRELLADSSLSKESLTKGFHLGEAFLRILGRHFWADYKILVFKGNPRFDTIVLVQFSSAVAQGQFGEVACTPSSC